jgi:hypothetical protein
METYVKTIYIRRKNPSAKVPDFLHTEASKSISSVYEKDGDVLRGLTQDEERTYLPMLKGIGASDPMFAAKAREFWSEVSFKVPPGEGLKLDITLIKDGPKKDTPPLDDVQNIAKFIKWRYALKLKTCANSEAELKNNRGAIFYLYDPIAQKKKEGDIARSKREAYKIFLEVDQDEDKVEQILTMYDYVPEDLSADEKVAILDRVFNQDHNKFIRIALDKELEMKFFINGLVKYNIVRKIENNYVDGSKNYGNLESMIRFLKDQNNSDNYVAFRSS